jgi:hypothetical protein
VATVLSTCGLTPVAAATTTIFSNNFDSQSTGALITGTGANQFSGTVGASKLSVENTVVASPPNALSVTLGGGGSAYAYKQYRTGYTHHTLTFSLQLGPDFVMPRNDYLVLAQTVSSTSSTVGKVDVILPADNRIHLDYVDSAEHQQVLGGRFVVPSVNWHTVALHETVGAGRGSLTLLVDGTSVSGGSQLYLGTQGLAWFAVGERFSPPGSGTAGHLYIDNVTATSTT